MEFIGITFMTDDGEDMINIRAIRTMIPWNCILRTLTFHITEQEVAVVHLPLKDKVFRISEH